MQKDSAVGEQLWVMISTLSCLQFGEIEFPEENDSDPRIKASASASGFGKAWLGARTSRDRVKVT